MARSRATDFETKQRHLLRKAAVVFAESGMDKASMARIATHAGVSKALLYHYYPGKDALIYDIIHSHLSDLDQVLDRAECLSAAPADRLRRLVHATLEAYRDADCEHKVQLNAGPMLDDTQRANLVALERRILRHFATVLSELDPGLAGTPQLMPVTMSLFGMMNWVYMWFREDGPIARAAYADLATDLILGGLPRVMQARGHGNQRDLPAAP